jgi:RNA polymerase sigma-70 factor (ECF subfamily)
MAARGPDPPARLSAAEFTARFQGGARVLWTLAAGLLGDPSEAEDVCQEAFVAAYAKRAQFDPATNFQAWMGRFIRNVAANEVRKRARRNTATADPLVLDGERAAGAPSSAERALDDAEALEAELDAELARALRELGEVPRACFLLRTLRELSYAEIAALLAIPEGTAMSHVHRARLALRARLEAAPEAPVRTRAEIRS